MIEIENVSFAYWNEPGELPKYAVRDITLHMKEGEYVGIVGHNGSGKSTLARLLNGLLVPSEGSIAVDRFSVGVPSALPELRRRIQLVFQNPESQIVGITPEEDIAFGLSNIGFPTERMAERIDRCLKLVNLENRRSTPIYQLSGGEKQRLALASVLALAPRYLIMDEATSMLDSAARTDFLEKLHNIRRTEGWGLIQITHRLEEVLEADRVVLMREGRADLVGSPRSIDPSIYASFGLELPYFAELGLHLREAGASISWWPTEEEVVSTVCAWR